jgi:hypothetical protein
MLVGSSYTWSIMRLMAKIMGSDFQVWHQDRLLVQEHNVNFKASTNTNQTVTLISTWPVAMTFGLHQEFCYLSDEYQELC